MTAPIVLSEQDLDCYRANGYWIAPVVVGQARIDRLRGAMARAYNGDLDFGHDWPYVPPIVGDAPGAIRTALFSWYVNREIRELVFDPAIAGIAAQLLGVERVRVWQDQAIWKPGSPGTLGDEANIGFHQDYAYWQDSSTTNMISANVALQDTTIDNGALQVFAGSHLGGLLNNADGFFDTDIESLKRRFAAETGIAEPTALNLKAGQVSFHHSLTVHGSGPNVTEHARMVVAPGYMPDGTYYREEGQTPCPHSEFLGAERTHGMPFAGEFFPVVQLR